MAKEPAVESRSCSGCFTPAPIRPSLRVSDLDVILTMTPNMAREDGGKDTLFICSFFDNDPLIALPSVLTPPFNAGVRVKGTLLGIGRVDGG